MRAPAKNMNIPAPFIREAPHPFEIGEAVRHLRLISGVLFQAHAPPRPHRITAPAWLLEVFLDGEIEVAPLGGGWRTRGAGEGVLYPPGTWFYERGRQGRHSPYRSLYVLFTDDSRWLSNRLFEERSFWWIADRQGLLRNLIGGMVEGQSGCLGASLSAFGELLQIVALLISAEKRHDTLLIRPLSEATPGLVRKLHRFMGENLARPLRIADLARHAGLSESALSHKYRCLTGRTPMQVLREMRVEAAKHLLLRGGLKLETVAGMTGFADAFHLSRTFKRLVGECPRSYRQSE